MTRPYATVGTGIILPSERPGSAMYSGAGLIAPTRPGWTSIIEPWKALLASAARFVPTEDMIAASLEFTVAYPAGSNDQCDVGILDAYGGIVAHSGLTSALLNTAGDKQVTLASPPNLYGGRVYYAAFSYGSVGTSAAVLRCANYPIALQNSGHITGFGASTYGQQDTALWATVGGTLTSPSSYYDWGQAVAMAVREW